MEFSSFCRSPGPERVREDRKRHRHTRLQKDRALIRDTSAPTCHLTIHSEGAKRPTAVRVNPEGVRRTTQMLIGLTRGLVVGCRKAKGEIFKCWVQRFSLKIKTER